MPATYQVGQRLRLPHRDHERRVDAIRDAVIVAARPAGGRRLCYVVHVYLPGGLFVERHHDAAGLKAMLRFVCETAANKKGGTCV